MRRPRRHLALFLVFAALGHALWAVALEHGPRQLRDPEYARRLAAARRWQQSGRETVLVLGSSRVAYGVRPAEADPTHPVPVNFALVGAGPVMQLLALRRALADGLTPSAVVAEYWPPFLRQDGPYREEARIERSRLYLADAETVRGYFHDPEATLERMRSDRFWSVSRHRRATLNLVAPRWLPLPLRTDGMWKAIDATGWLPGRESMTDAEREQARQATLAYYVPLFQGYHVGADSDRAFAEIAEECRRAGVPLYLLYLPEADHFRALMSSELQCQADAHLMATARTLGAGVIDARTWVGSGELPDGFHLLSGGAQEFTRKLAADLAGRATP